MTTLEIKLNEQTAESKAAWLAKMEDWADHHFDKVWEKRNFLMNRWQRAFDLIQRADFIWHRNHPKISRWLTEVYRNAEFESRKKYYWIGYWEGRKDEWMEKQRKLNIEEWHDNMKKLVSKCRKFNINEANLETEFIGMQGKGFNIILTDGTGREIHARMIWAAEFSYLVRPHVRYIITERKTK